MTHGGRSIFTYRRLIPDSGCVEERERLLSLGEGEGLGVTVSSSVSSLPGRKIQQVSQKLSHVSQRLHILTAGHLL